MAASEHWTEPFERRRFLIDSDDSRAGSGPVLYVENGRRYIDDSEGHIEVIGSTGKGKSQCASLPFNKEVLMKHENLIVVDPKRECYRMTACRIPEDYQVFCIDFRNPYQSLTFWNPLYYPYELYKYGTPEDRDTASLMISELWAGLFPEDPKSDPFWPQTAANTCKGLTYMLYDTAEPSQINMQSICRMMEQLEEKTGGIAVYKTLYDKMSSGSMAKRFFSSYATAPNDTRGSIHSVADNGLEVFSRSVGLMHMLAEDTLFTKLDISRPFVIYIVLPDETDIYHGLAGVLVSQLTRHLIRLAQESGGALKRRVNLILEELGSIGRSIPELSNLMTAGRSRNLRMMLVLQDGSQLEDVYGASKSKAIEACVGITIGFSTNSWSTLEEWSRRCGDRRTGQNGDRIEPLITPVELAAMETGQALIMVDRRYKFITRLPKYADTEAGAWREPEPVCNSFRKETDVFDVKQYLEDMRKKEQEELLKGFRPEPRQEPRPEPREEWFPTDMLAEKKPAVYTIRLAEGTKPTDELAALVAEEIGIPLYEAKQMIRRTDRPLFRYRNYTEARRMLHRLKRMNLIVIFNRED